MTLAIHLRRLLKAAYSSHRENVMTFETDSKKRWLWPQTAGWPYDVDVLSFGYPGQACYHGALGWSSICILRDARRVALVDTGGFGQRNLLLSALRDRGLTPEDVTDVLLTHAHWDHIVNWAAFPNAAIWIGDDEIEWASRLTAGTSAVPEFQIPALKASGQMRTLRTSEAAIPGVVALATPGHTPGHLTYVLEGAGRHLIFAGDAVKNLAELISGNAETSENPDQSARTIASLNALLVSTPRCILVPGHDQPLRILRGQVRRIGMRRSKIVALLSDSLSRRTFFSLTSARKRRRGR